VTATAVDLSRPPPALRRRRRVSFAGAHYRSDIALLGNRSGCPPRVRGRRCHAADWERDFVEYVSARCVVAAHRVPAGVATGIRLRPTPRSFPPSCMGRGGGSISSRASTVRRRTLVRSSSTARRRFWNLGAAGRRGTRSGRPTDLVDERSPCSTRWWRCRRNSGRSSCCVLEDLSVAETPRAGHHEHRQEHRSRGLPVACGPAGLAHGRSTAAEGACEMSFLSEDDGRTRRRWRCWSGVSRRWGSRPPTWSGGAPAASA